MISSEEASSRNSHHQHQDQKKFKGVRRRKWGKWVSEIRVPGTQDRLWLGSYATAEAAAVAHDIAFFCLRGSSTSLLAGNLNFPHQLPPGLPTNLSPRSIQRAASDAGMAIDARAATALPSPAPPPPHNVSSNRAVQEVPMWSGGDEHSSGDIIGGSTSGSGDATSAIWQGMASMGQDGHYSCGDDQSFTTPADYNYYYP